MIKVQDEMSKLVVGQKVNDLLHTGGPEHGQVCASGNVPLL